MIPLSRRLQQFQSMWSHGGPFRACSVICERLLKGFSTRSLTYSWPKETRVVVDEGAPLSTWFFFPHLLSQHSFAGLQTLLQIAQQKIGGDRSLNLIVTDFSGSRDAFFTALNLSERQQSELRSSKLQFWDWSEKESFDLRVHPQDEFYVSAWWTMKPLYEALPEKLFARLTYIVQDDESLFYSKTDAVEQELKATAQSSYVPGISYLINSRSLADHLSLHYGINQDNCASWKVFEPLVDRKIFFWSSEMRKQRKIFVYARPQVARNRFDLCWEALVCLDSLLDPRWEMVAAGTLTKDLVLPSGRRLEARGKLSLPEYAKLLQESAVGLSLMESPHPSHPPLELEACGSWVVTNKFSTKDLSQRFERIYSADLDAEDISQVLWKAVQSARQTWSYLDDSN